MEDKKNLLALDEGLKGIFYRCFRRGRKNDRVRNALSPQIYKACFMCCRTEEKIEVGKTAKITMIHWEKKKRKKKELRV